MKARELYNADLARYYAHFPPLTRWQRFVYPWRHEGMWAIAFFRFGQFLHAEAPRAVRAILSLPYRVVQKWVASATGIHLSPGTPIGPGFYIGHCGGIWVTSLARIGANCSISQGVTIGLAGGRDRRSGPELGDRVWVGPNAVITGHVRIGNGAVVGANSLVASNIPENGVAIGVPARVFGYSGSKELIPLAGQQQPIWNRDTPA